jgi:hypothetical protein
VELKRPPYDPEFDDYDDDTDSITVDEDDRQDDDSHDGEVSSTAVTSPQTDDTWRQKINDNEKLSK